MIINTNYFINPNQTSFKAKSVRLSKAKINKLVAQGKSAKEIGKILDSNAKVIYKFAKENGIILNVSSKKTPFPIKDVTKCLNQGLSYQEIAKKFGVLISRIRYFAVTRGLRPDNAKEVIIKYKNTKINAPVEEVKKYLAEGKTLNQLAKIYECAQLTVRTFLKKHNLHTKDGEKLANVTKKQFKKLLDSGKRQSEIAKILGVEAGSISGLYKKFKLKNPNIAVLESLSKQETQELIQEYRSIPKLAKHLKVSEMALRKQMKKQGVESLYVRAGNIHDIVIPTKETVQNLVESGAHLNELCQKFDLPLSKVKAILKLYDLRTL